MSAAALRPVQPHLRRATPSCASAGSFSSWPTAPRSRFSTLATAACSATRLFSSATASRSRVSSRAAASACSHRTESEPRSAQLRLQPHYLLSSTAFFSDVSTANTGARAIARRAASLCWSSRTRASAASARSARLPFIASLRPASSSPFRIIPTSRSSQQAAAWSRFSDAISQPSDRVRGGALCSDPPQRRIAPGERGNLAASARGAAPVRRRLLCALLRR